MNREEYLARLRKALSSLPASEVTDICGDFEEHFAIGLSQDKTEHEISAELGDPERVAGSYLGDAGEAVSTEDAVRAAANCAGNHGGASSANAAEQEKDLTGPRLFVILFNVLVMIWVAFAWLTTLFSLWCVTLAFLAVGIGLLIVINSYDDGEKVDVESPFFDVHVDGDDVSVNPNNQSDDKDTTVDTGINETENN